MMRSNSKRRRGRGRQEPVDPVSSLIDPEYGIYIQDYFMERLRSERQRSARSNRPLLMMLLDVEGLPESEREDTLPKAVTAVSASVRETDLKGWYKNELVIGVLFIEIGPVDRHALKKKVLSKLSEKLKPTVVSRLLITFHVFPADVPTPPGGSEAQRPEVERPADNRVFYPDLTKTSMSRSVYVWTKRSIDLVGSLVGLSILSPVFLAIAVAIKASSKGPIIFRQERVGLLGQKFVLLKFRSMATDNDPSVHREYVHSLIARQRNGDVSNGNGSNGNGVYKLTNDTRVTKIGRFLRKTSLDELPQFFNVLMGEMSLVGPRPPIPYELERYEVWHRRRVLEVKPGLSGLWQVKGRSTTTFDEMVRLDLQYMRQQSLWLDLKILVQTPWAVVKTRGAH